MDDVRLVRLRQSLADLDEQLEHLRDVAAAAMRARSVSPSMYSMAM